MVTSRKPNKRPSMFEVAKLAGVSHQTVSRVINDSPDVSDATRARVQAAIDELGYRPLQFRSCLGLPPFTYYRFDRWRPEVLWSDFRHYLHRIYRPRTWTVHERDDGA